MTAPLCFLRQIDGSTLRTLCLQHGPLVTFHLNLTQGNAVVRYSSKDEAAKAQKSLHMCVSCPPPQPRCQQAGLGVFVAGVPQGPGTKRLRHRRRLSRGSRVPPKAFPLGSWTATLRVSPPGCLSI